MDERKESFAINDWNFRESSKVVSDMENTEEAKKVVEAVGSATNNLIHSYG